MGASFTPDERSAILCRECYDEIKALIDNAEGDRDGGSREAAHDAHDIRDEVGLHTAEGYSTDSLSAFYTFYGVLASKSIEAMW